MKILLAESAAKKRSFTVKEFLQFSDIESELSAEVVASFLVSRQEENIYNLDGSFTAAVVTSCDRCANPVKLDLEQDFFYQLRVEEEPQMAAEYGCTDEDCDVTYLAEPVFESSDILREQLLLALPATCLCSDMCRGLCDRCGTNLNEKQCKCKEKNEDSPFAILKKLQKN